jgi:hypothetical protein
VEQAVPRELEPVQAAQPQQESSFGWRHQEPEEEEEQHRQPATSSGSAWSWRQPQQHEEEDERQLQQDDDEEEPSQERWSSWRYQLEAAASEEPSASGNGRFAAWLDEAREEAEEAEAMTREVEGDGEGGGWRSWQEEEELAPQQLPDPDQEPLRLERIPKRIGGDELEVPPELEHEWESWRSEVRGGRLRRAPLRQLHGSRSAAAAAARCCRAGCARPAAPAAALLPRALRLTVLLPAPPPVVGAHLQQQRQRQRQRPRPRAERRVRQRLQLGLAQL